MKTLEQFKAEIGVTDIKLMKNKTGRRMAFLGDSLLLLSKDCDTKKQIYVKQITEDKDKNPITESVVVGFNTNLEEAGTI